MIHTASLLHDDVLDHALTRYRESLECVPVPVLYTSHIADTMRKTSHNALFRRGKPSVNFKWDARRSTFAGLLTDFPLFTL